MEPTVGFQPTKGFPDGLQNHSRWALGYIGEMAQPGGFEPPSPTVTGWCISRLCYGCNKNLKWLPLEVPPLLPLVQSQVDYFHPQGQIKWSAHYNPVASQVVEAMGKPNKPDPYYCSLLCPVELHSPPCVGNDRSRTGNPRISINNYFDCCLGLRNQTGGAKRI